MRKLNVHLFFPSNPPKPTQPPKRNLVRRRVSGHHGAVEPGFKLWFQTYT